MKDLDYYMGLGYKLRKHKRVFISLLAVLLAAILLLGGAAPFLFYK